MIASASRLARRFATWLGPAAPSTRYPRREGLCLALALLATLPLVTVRIYASDEIAYFSYLRSLVKDGDLHFENEYRHYVPDRPEARAEFDAWLPHIRTPTGHLRNVNPAGSALLWAPAYLATDAALASRGSHARQGYERPYVRAVTWSSAAFAGAGLLVLHGWLRRRVRRGAAAWALAATWLGTNLFFYVYVTPPMSHANSFFLSACTLVLWATTRHRRSIASRVGLGALIGVAAMVREQNVFLLVLPGIDTALAMGAAWRAGDVAGCRREALRGLLCLAVAVLAFAPQLVIYDVLSGHPRPHHEATSKMHWFDPAIRLLLFSGWHGFFSWSPLALPGAVGLVLLARREPSLALPLLVFAGLEIWSSAAYDTWEAGASFGARRLITILPALTLGAAQLAEGLLARAGELRARARGAVAVGLATVLVAGVLWNVGLIVQYATGMIPRGDAVTIDEIVHNQLHVVPVRAPGLLWGYLTDRSRYYAKP